MQDYSGKKENKRKYMQNREVSWLNFNERVLEEAEDRKNPLMERLKFVSIFTSNLDEFFMVRAGSLYDLDAVCPEDRDPRSGMTPFQQLEKIYSTVPRLLEKKKNIYKKVTGALERNNVKDTEFADLDQAEKKSVKKYYKENILPLLSPIIIGSHHPVPHLNNKGLYIAVLLENKQKKQSVGLIPVPEILPPYLKFAGRDYLHYIRMENILMRWAGTLFGSYTLSESCVISVTRNADISFDDDKFDDRGNDFRSRVVSLLKSRDHLSVIRLETDRPVSDAFRGKLARLTRVRETQIFTESCPLNMKYVFSLEEDLPPELKEKLLYEPYEPRWPEDLDTGYSIIDQIQQKDELLYYPYDSTEPFLRLLSEAAERPDVLSIKITIYRLASSSKIARILCRAAENGKQVIVLMELRARFDEANNIEWSKLLENAGCQLIYGVEDFKCHSKICQITMMKHGRLNYITQIGTGNYNEKTNRMYTDLSYITASEEIGEDATLFFQNLLVNKLDGDYAHLLVSPDGIEKAVMKKIDEEIEKGKEGYVCIKINSLTDCEMIEKLVEASQAGVTVQMIVRGICCILPGIRGYTENIHITSIVGRYLEHARIYAFGKGEECTMYISSADFMGRNLHHRVEVACPVTDRKIRNQLGWILNGQLRDTEKACIMNFAGGYTRKACKTGKPVNCQEEGMKTSIHDVVSYIPPGIRFVKKIQRCFRKKKEVCEAL